MTTITLLNCPKCPYSIKRANKLEKHIHDAHRIDPETLYRETFHKNVTPACRCGCGILLTWKNWRKGYGDAVYLRGHNASDASDETKSKRSVTLKEGYDSGRIRVWSEGQSKETNAALAQGAVKRSVTVSKQFASGERVQWAKGKTKETDERVAHAAQLKKKKFADGLEIPWAKGKTKETDERVAAMAETVRSKLTDPDLRARLDAIKKLDENVVVSRIARIAPSMRLLNEDSGWYAGINEQNIELACLACGEKKHASLYSLNDRCIKCNPNDSREQLEIKKFISTLGFNPITTREIIAPLELDVFIRERSFAVEHNGLYWHSEQKKSDKNYHATKTKLCNDAGVRLLHVFSDEWHNKQSIVKSMIMSRLGMCTQKIHARTCTVEELDDVARRAFFNATHIDGDARASRAFGLINEGNVISAMSLRRPMHASNAEMSIEIARFSSLLDHSVPGALGKLTAVVCKLASEMKKQLMTYVDERLGDGHGYEKVGFKFLNKTQPRFWWTDNVDRFDRFKFRADKERGMSEEEVAAEAGVHRVWGCPNRVYVLR